jgi:hypothetical protein
MSGAAPSDLAVAFRSLHRRTADALASVGGDRSVATAELGTLDQVIGDTAATLGTAADAEAIAAELHDRPADAWTDDVLDRVRELALKAGHAIRDIERAAENAADRAR